MGDAAWERLGRTPRAPRRAPTLVQVGVCGPLVSERLERTADELMDQVDHHWAETVEGVDPGLEKDIPKVNLNGLKGIAQYHEEGKPHGQREPKRAGDDRIPHTRSFRRAGVPRTSGGSPRVTACQSWGRR